jgi:dynein heavy chain
MQPRASGGAGDGIKVEDLVYMQAGEMFDRIPNKIDFDPSQLANPLEVFRRQELDRFNILLSKLKFTLAQLQLGIKGEVVMS